jgi:hypothetical protein
MADRPELISFFETLPADLERDRLADAYRCLSQAYHQAGSRARELQPRLDAIVGELVEAAGKRRETLLAEYATLAAELELLPRLRLQTARRFAEALGDWVKYVRPQVIRERDRLNAGLARIDAEMTPHLRTVS